MGDRDAFVQSSADSNAFIQSSADNQVFGLASAAAATPLPAGVWWALGYNQTSGDWEVLRMAGISVHEAYPLPALARDISETAMRGSMAGTHEDNIYVLCVENAGLVSVMYHLDLATATDGNEVPITKTVVIREDLPQTGDSPWFEEYEYLAICGTSVANQGLYWTTGSQRDLEFGGFGEPKVNYGQFDDATLEPIASTTVDQDGFGRSASPDQSPFAHDTVQEYLLRDINEGVGGSWREDVLDYDTIGSPGTDIGTNVLSDGGNAQIHRFGTGDDEGALMVADDTEARVRIYANDLDTLITSANPSGYGRIEGFTGLPMILSTGTVASRTSKGTALIDLCPSGSCTPTNSYSEIACTFTLPTSLQTDFQIEGAAGAIEDTDQSVATGSWTNVEFESDPGCWTKFKNDICTDTNGYAYKSPTAPGSSATFKFITNEAGGSNWAAGNATQLILYLKPK